MVSEKRKEWIIIQLGRNLQKTLSSYHQVPEAKILFWKQSPIGAFRQSGPKNQKDASKTIRGGKQNLKDR